MTDKKSLELIEGHQKVLEQQAEQIELITQVLEKIDKRLLALEKVNNSKETG